MSGCTSLGKGALGFPQKCAECVQKCCSRLNELGLILFPKELERLEELRSSEQLLSEGEFFVLETDACPALTSDGLCGVYHQRPVDCSIYPLSLILVDGGFWWIIDENCPGTSAVTPEYLQRAASVLKDAAAGSGLEVRTFAELVARRCGAASDLKWVILCEAEL